MLCPKCGAVAPDGSRFCEIDGTPLVTENGAGPVAAVIGPCRCGASAEAVDAQGFCTECGIQRRTRDHKELAPAPHFAGVTDRGRRHPKNEDDLALAMEAENGQPVYLMVVCDGVSSSEEAAEAAAIAVQKACDSLMTAVRAGGIEIEAAITAAIRAAQEGVCAIGYSGSGIKDPPETTIVAAVVREGTAIIGWVGDSRAYWISPEQALLLTHDHSWVNEMVAAGAMTEEEAMRSPGAHAITRCLGGLTDDPPPEPSLTTFPMPGPGLLLLCTDGLWNYAFKPEQIAGLVAQAPTSSCALDIARDLVEFAVAQGGRDNITAALLSVQSPTSGKDGDAHGFQAGSVS